MMIFDLPLPPDMLNARKHWRAKNREKKSFYYECDRWAYLATSAPKCPPSPWESVAVKAHFRLWNAVDPTDNLPARMKHVMDWLVTRGYILDDSPKVIRSTVVTQEIDRKNRGLRVELVP